MLFPPKEFRQLFRVDFPYPRLRERCSALQGAPCKGFPSDCMAAELTWERGRPALTYWSNAARLCRLGPIIWPSSGLVD